MKRDLELLKAVEEAPSPLTVVRIYSWLGTTVSLGCHQEPSRVVDLDYCHREGVEVVVRPTGGRAVLHGSDLTYAVVSNDRDHFALSGVTENYRRIAEALRKAFEELGARAEILAVSSSGRRMAHPRLARPCFASPSRFELLCDGRKVVGSAQKRLRRAFLQHGSIPLQVDYEEMALILKSRADLLRRSLISLSEATGGTLSGEEVGQSLVRGFESRFGVSLVEDRR